MCNDDSNYYYGSDYFYGFNIARVMFSDERRVNQLESDVISLECDVSALQRDKQKLQQWLTEAYSELTRLQCINRANVRMGRLLMEKLEYYNPDHPLLNDNFRQTKIRQFMFEEFEKMENERQK